MIWWVVLLFAMGITLILAEFVVPGGICGAAGGLLLVASCVVGVFGFPSHIGMIVLIEFFGALICVFLGLFVLPKTRLVRGLVLDAPGLREGWVSTESDESLVGATAEVLTPLRPAGTITHGRRRIDAVSTGEFIGAGEKIRVIEVHGNRVVVERAEPDLE
ncbi:MAG: hypothetical protein JXR94_00640 [Candidatus Hydrogenedentes bacterium]|nr:hypothetical protein [Candidatus Hydrogenedentota bacterium]